MELLSLYYTRDFYSWKVAILFYAYSTTRTKDSTKLYKGQVKDRSRHGIKKELKNGDLTSFLSLVCGDPYGN